MATQTKTYVLIHVFGTARDELDRHPLERKTFTGWLREYTPFAHKRWVEIANVVDMMAEHGWHMIGSSYDCDLLLERDLIRGDAELDRGTELIESSTIAVETSVHEGIGGAYRKNDITTLELRVNTMKRNRGGERDLDHIMMAAIRGLDRVHLEYPVRSGLILCLVREFTYQQNEIIVDKALRYQNRGIVGIDIAGARGVNFRYA